jgi:hypothetical protein
MRRGRNGLALQVQETLGRDPFVGDLFVFRGAGRDLINILWHDGIGLSLYAKAAGARPLRVVVGSERQRCRSGSPVRLHSRLRSCLDKAEVADVLRRPLASSLGCQVPGGHVIVWYQTTSLPVTRFPKSCFSEPILKNRANWSAIANGKLGQDLAPIHRKLGLPHVSGAESWQFGM